MSPLPGRVRPRPFFVLLIIGGFVLLAFVLWRVLTVGVGSNTSLTNVGNANGSRGGALASCGDGICQNVVCLSIGCPEAETEGNCPADCGAESEAANDGEASSTEGENVNGGATSGALNFSAVPQSLEEKAVCPVEESNLTPSDAVRVAKEAGLEPGVKPVDVRLAKSQEPLDECVWTVKNFLTADGGRIFRIVDSSQEVFEKTSWRAE